MPKYLELQDGTKIPVHSDAFVELFDGIEVMIPDKAKGGDRWEVCVKPYTEPCPLTSTTLGDSVFISNNQRLLSEIKSNLVQTHRDTKETEGWCDLSSRATYDLRSTKLVTHYNHIFLAKGRTLYWTDLDNVWNWYPRPTNEADFRAIEWESEDITALIEVNDMLFIHFPTAVYTCEYIGKPTIVRISQRNEGHGAVSQNAIVAHKNSQFYMGVDNFYQWSPVEGVVPIGESVWRRIVNPDLDKIFTYVDRVNKEIHWVIGKDIWAFNYVERHWSRYSSNNINSHITVPKMTTTTLQQDLNNQSSLKTEPDSMKGLYNLWSKDCGLYRTFEAGDSVAKTCFREQPYLISDEQTYGDIFGEKETDKVVVDGSYGVGLDGFEIEIAAKKFVSDPDKFKHFAYWHHERHIKQTDSKKHSGRSLKFKFILRDKVAKWDGSFLSQGHVFAEGLKVHVWNGTYKLDGCHNMRYLHRGVWDGGTTYLNGQLRLDIGQCMLYAWGERVLLPNPPVGEDK